MAAHRHHGVVPICRTLQVAPSAVRSAMSRPVCARRQADDTIKPLLLEVFNANYRVYGRRKLKAAMRREHGINLDKDRIARLMAELGIRGATRTKSTVTTRSLPQTHRPASPVGSTGQPPAGSPHLASSSSKPPSSNRVFCFFSGLAVPERWPRRAAPRSPGNASTIMVALNARLLRRVDLRPGGYGNDVARPIQRWPARRMAATVGAVSGRLAITVPP